MSLAEHHVACYEAFQRACAISDGGKPSELPDQFDRYKLWAGNVGAAHSGHTYTLSLDYRLREASFYKEQVTRLLVILCRHLNKAAQLLNGERTPFEAFPSDRRLDNADFSPNGAIIPSPEADDSSWEISSDSESDASFHPPPQRYQSSQPATSEEDTELLADSTSSEGLQELPQTLESIKLTVASLFKLPIRRPAPVDRLNDRATDETSCFQPFDAMYIKDKFQGLEEQLATRLGSMITQRRQLLLYRKRHWQHLRTDCTEGSSPFHHHHANEEHGGPQRAIGNGDDTGSAMRSSTGEESRHDRCRIMTTSKATTLNIKNGPRLHLDHLEHLSVPPIGQSVTETSIQASEHTRQLRLNVPPRPKDPFGAPKDCFQCPYCHLVQMISSERTWRKHVIADLQPYVCTFLHCNLSDHFFESREAWYEHETENHRVELFCNTAGHPSYTNQPDFEEHIRMHHGADMAAKLPASLFGMFKRPLRASEMTCNLCFRKTKSLKSHVARHLEQISLFAVPRADYSNSDEDLNQGSNVAQDNAQESDIEDLDVDDPQIRSTWDTDSQASKLDEVPPPGKGTEHVMPVWESLELEQPEVPDTEGGIWDTVTDKFAQARSGLAEAVPPGLVPAGADQKLSSNLNGQPTPRTRFQEAIKAIIALHRHRKMKRTRGGLQMANMIIIDATAGHPSQKESVERMNELAIMFAQRFADYRPILRVVDKDTGILRLRAVEEAIQDVLSHHGPESMLGIFIMGPPEAAVEVMQTSNTRRSLAEILFKFICREVEGKGANIVVHFDSGNPWADPTAAAEPIFKMEADATKGLDEAEWTFPVLVACRPDSSTPMSQAAPFTASAVSAIFKLIEKGRTYMLRDFLDATIAELPKGQKIIWLGPDREHLAYTVQFTPRTIRTASMNLPSSRSAHITILLVNLACTVWLLALYRRRLSRYTPLSRLMTTEPIGETANASPAILAFQKWKLISRIRRLKERLLQTRVLFLWRMSLANGSASDTRVPGVGAADGSYSGEGKAFSYPQRRNSTASRADVDFTVPLAEKAVARVVEQGFSTSEAEFALVHTRSQDGQISVERALEFLNGLS